MSQIVNAILGRRVTEDSSVPIPVTKHRVARKAPPTDKEEGKLKKVARTSSIVAHIIGMAESDDEAIIPKSAKPLDPFTHQIPGMVAEPPGAVSHEEPSEPAVTNIHGEQLIPPTAALVAPDVTPKVMQLIDPSQVPKCPAPAPTGPKEGAMDTLLGREAAPEGGEGALDTLLGRQNATPQPAQAMADSMMAEVVHGSIQERVAAKLMPANEGGEGMPSHKEGDGKTVYNTFRRFYV
jgi:hypothetical protein